MLKNNYTGATGAVMEHLLKYGDITSAEAIGLYGCYRLSARIKDFRDAGWNIVTVTARGVNRFGEPTRYARYVLVKEKERDKDDGVTGSKI